MSCPITVTKTSLSIRDAYIKVGEIIDGINSDYELNSEETSLLISAESLIGHILEHHKEVSEWDI